MSSRLPQPSLRLTLYVAGHAPNSNSARLNLRAVLDAAGLQALVPEIVDVLDDPARAAADRVLFTPMLVKLEPPPICRVIGSLTDHSALRASLGLGIPGR